LSDGDKEELVADDVDRVPASYAEQDEILRDILGDEMDIEEFGTEDEFVNATNNADNLAAEERVQLDNVEELAEIHDVLNRSAIDHELSRLLPTGTGIESTKEAFQRLTNNCAWIPF
jgi:hypothetical protein